MMTRTQQSEDKDKSRQRIAAEKMTTAQKIHRALQSGPLKSELRTSAEAIWMAKALDRQLKQKMKAEGLEPKDSAVLLCYMTPDLAVLSTLPFVDGQEQSINSTLTAPGTCSIMVGLILCIRERDPKVLKEHGTDDLVLMGARPFLNTPLVLTALKTRMTEGGPN